jgi:hypothetical protein
MQSTWLAGGKKDVEMANVAVRINHKMTQAHIDLYSFIEIHICLSHPPQTIHDDGIAILCTLN